MSEEGLIGKAKVVEGEDGYIFSEDELEGTRHGRGGEEWKDAWDEEEETDFPPEWIDFLAQHNADGEVVLREEDLECTKWDEDFSPSEGFFLGEEGEEEVLDDVLTLEGEGEGDEVFVFDDVLTLEDWGDEEDEEPRQEEPSVADSGSLMGALSCLESPLVFKPKPEGPSRRYYLEFGRRTRKEERRAKNRLKSLSKKKDAGELSEKERREVLGISWWIWQTILFCLPKNWVSHSRQENK